MVQTCHERTLIEDTLFPVPEVGWLYTDAQNQGKNSSVGKLFGEYRQEPEFRFPIPTSKAECLQSKFWKAVGKSSLGFPGYSALVSKPQVELESLNCSQVENN